MYNCQLKDDAVLARCRRQQKRVSWNACTLLALPLSCLVMQPSCSVLAVQPKVALVLGVWFWCLWARTERLDKAHRECGPLSLFA